MHQSSDRPLAPLDLRPGERAKVITCDESGSEGENLLSIQQRVFAHGSHDLDPTEAEGLMANLRQLYPTQASEYKSSQLLKDPGAIEWFLNQPLLRGRAFIYLLDKQFMAVSKIIDLLVEELSYERGVDIYTDRKARHWARTLMRQGPQAFGQTKFEELMQEFNSLMRSKQRKGTKATVDSFFELVDSLRLASRRRSVDEIMDLIWRARPHAEAFQRDLVSHDGLATLDPLSAALPQTIRVWVEESREPIVVIHDQTNILTQERIDELRRSMMYLHPEFRRFARPIRVAEVRLEDSRLDSRIQVADLLAGVGRMAAEESLRGSVGHEFLLVRQLIAERCLWYDEPSWMRLAGRALDA